MRPNKAPAWRDKALEKSKDRCKNINSLRGKEVADYEEVEIKEKPDNLRKPIKTKYLISAKTSNKPQKPEQLSELKDPKVEEEPEINELLKEFEDIVVEPIESELVHENGEKSSSVSIEIPQMKKNATHISISAFNEMKQIKEAMIEERREKDQKKYDMIAEEYQQRLETRLDAKRIDFYKEFRDEFRKKLNSMTKRQRSTMEKQLKEKKENIYSELRTEFQQKFDKKTAENHEILEKQLTEKKLAIYSELRSEFQEKFNKNSLAQKELLEKEFKKRKQEIFTELQVVLQAKLAAKLEGQPFKFSGEFNGDGDTYISELDQLIEKHISDGMAEYTRQAKKREQEKINELVARTRKRKQELQAKLEMKNTEKLAKKKKQLDDKYEAKEKQLKSEETEAESLKKEIEKDNKSVKRARQELNKKQDELDSFRKSIEEFENRLNAIRINVYDKEMANNMKEQELLIREEPFIEEEIDEFSNYDEQLSQEDDLMKAERKLGELSTHVSKQRKSCYDIKERLMNLEKKNMLLKKDLNKKELKLSNKENLMMARNRVITMAKDLFSNKLSDIEPVNKLSPRVGISSDLAALETELPPRKTLKPLAKPVREIKSSDASETKLTTKIAKSIKSDDKTIKLGETLLSATEREESIAEITQKLKSINFPKSKKIKRKKQVKRKEQLLTSKLDPKLTFNNYDVSDHNRIVYSIARDIGGGNGSGNEFKMLYIYGEIGLGKTHLLHAIGNNVKDRDSDQNVLYLPIKDLMKSLKNAVKNKKEKEFKEKFNSVNVLLLDDFQRLNITKASQNLFYEVLNDFLRNNNHMVLTGDRPIKEIKELDKSFTNRLLSMDCLTTMNLTSSGIEIMENGLKNLSR
jgi:DNA replication protein DnaC